MSPRRAAVDAAERRDLERIERRRRGEPTLPLSSELAGLSDDEQHRLIVDAARAVVAFNARPALEAAERARVRLLERRTSAEKSATPVELGDLRQPPPRVPGTSCPWCGRPRCAEHLELERAFQQAAG